MDLTTVAEKLKDNNLRIFKSFKPAPTNKKGKENQTQLGNNNFKTHKTSKNLNQGLEQ